MSSRIPPSLNWLINKRARLAGDITKAEKRANELYRLKLKEIEVLRRDLSIIDATIRLHEIQIDPKCIRPIKGQR